MRRAPVWALAAFHSGTSRWRCVVVDRFSLTDLIIPIVAAPMAGGLSTPQLAAAAPNTGRLGFLAAGMVPATGGHRATFDQGVTPPNAPLEDLVVALAAGLGCPVLAAGGLSAASDVKRVRELDALAAQVGTAVLLADEAGTNPVHRAALRDPQFDQTTVTGVFTGRYARSLRNRFIDEHGNDAIIGFPAAAKITGLVLVAAVRNGDAHGTSLWAGTEFKSL